MCFFLIREEYALTCSTIRFGVPIGFPFETFTGGLEVMPAACSMICLDVDVHKDSITTAVQPRTPSVADERVCDVDVAPPGNCTVTSPFPTDPSAHHSEAGHS